MSVTERGASAGFLARGLIVAGVLLFAPPTYAQESQPPSPPPAQVSEARALYAEGLRHYNVGEYDTAIERFKRAYALTQAPELLFNLAQAHRLKGPSSCGEARRLYETYLRVEPETPKRASVEAAVADMTRCERETPDPKPVPVAPAAAPLTPPAEATPAPRPPSAAPLILGISGAVIAVAGASLYGWARLRYDALDERGCAPSCDSSLVDGPRTAQTVGGVLMIGGAATAATAVVLWQTGKTKATIAPTHTGAKIAVHF